MGWRTWRLHPAGDPQPDGWQLRPGAPAIANESYRILADPARGGALRSVLERSTGRELLRAGRLGNELRLYDEYPTHPQFGEGPWHLTPSGRVVGSGDRAAESVRVEQCPAGARIVVTGRVGEVRYEQRITLWHGLDRAEFRTRVLDFDGSDRLLRVGFGCAVPGARPVCEVAGAVIARGFAIPDVDSAKAPWTLDNPANTFFALSSTAHLRLQSADGSALGRAAVAVAEIVVADPRHAARDARELVLALGRIGVTATTSAAGGARPTCASSSAARTATRWPGPSWTRPGPSTTRSCAAASPSTARSGCWCPAAALSSRPGWPTRTCAGSARCPC
jgi:alpha-mannosidase